MSTRIAIRSYVAGGRTWVRDPADSSVRHRDGLPWHDRPIPMRFHRCVPQTVEIVWTENGDGAHVTGVLRCACGAVASAETGGAWRGRNSRRRAG